MTVLLRSHLMRKKNKPLLRSLKQRRPPVERQNPDRTSVQSLEAENLQFLRENNKLVDAEDARVWVRKKRQLGTSIKSKRRRKKRK